MAHSVCETQLRAKLDLGAPRKFTLPQLLKNRALTKTCIPSPFARPVRWPDNSYR
jgi:hypothetical protein